MRNLEMKKGDIEGYTVEEVVQITFTVPKKELENDTVDDMRDSGYDECKVRVVGLIPYLVQEYGCYYAENLLNTLISSMATYRVLDHGGAENFRARFEHLMGQYESGAVE